MRSSTRGEPRRNPAWQEQIHPRLYRGLNSDALAVTATRADPCTDPLKQSVDR